MSSRKWKSMYVRRSFDEKRMCEACQPITIISEKLGLRETLTNESVYYEK
jgi:hypothetical protein